MKYNWPGSSINLEATLEKVTESHGRAFLAEMASDTPEEDSAKEEPKESPPEASEDDKTVEYNGIDLLTWIEHQPDGSEKHYAKDIGSATK